MKKIIVWVFIMCIVNSLAGCENQKINTADSTLTEASTKSDVNLKKEIISLEDIEKAFSKEKINLVKKVTDQADFNILVEKLPAEYYLEGNKNYLLKVYVFNSLDERVKAREEYENKTAALDLAYREIYEIKNILVILIAGDNKNQCYQDVSKAILKLK